MSLEPSDAESYRARLEALRSSARDEGTLRALGDLRHELLAHASVADESPAPLDKFELLQRYLTVAPFPLPSDAPSGLRAVAESLQGAMWSLRIVESLNLRLSALTREYDSARARTGELGADIGPLQQRRGVLQGYVRMLDAFTGTGGDTKGRDA